MSRSKIEWLARVGTIPESWSPVTGCTAISEGCLNCYARRMATRLAGRAGYPVDDPFRPTLHRGLLISPSLWMKSRTVFVCSMGDLFHESIPDEFIDLVFHAMCRFDRHTYILLTKRPARMRWFMNLYYGGELSPLPPPHIWLGVTAENQQRADERIPVLLNTPAGIRFVSIEPMLGPVDLRAAVGCGYYCDERVDHVDHPFWTPGIAGGIHWVIAGGETGPGARPMHPAWIRSLRDQCALAGVPFFLKSWGEYRAADTAEQMIAYAALSGNDCRQAPGSPLVLWRIGHRHSGHDLDGQVLRQWPGFAANPLAKSPES